MYMCSVSFRDKQTAGNSSKFNVLGQGPTNMRTRYTPTTARYCFTTRAADGGKTKVHSGSGLQLPPREEGARMRG